MEGEFCVQCLDAVNLLQAQLQPFSLYLSAYHKQLKKEKDNIPHHPTSTNTVVDVVVEESKEELPILQESKEQEINAISSPSPSLNNVASGGGMSRNNGETKSRKEHGESSSAISQIADWLIPLRETLWYLEGRYIGALTCALPEVALTGSSTTSTSYPQPAVPVTSATTASSTASTAGGVSPNSSKTVETNLKKTPETWFESQLFGDIVSLSDDTPLSPFIQSLANINKIKDDTNSNGEIFFNALSEFELSGKDKLQRLVCFCIHIICVCYHSKCMGYIVTLVYT